MNPSTNKIASLTCGELALGIQAQVKQRLGLLAAAAMTSVVVLLFFDAKYLSALGCMFVGVFIPIVAWCSRKNPGLPLVGLITLQTLAIFGTPIFAQNPSLAYYPDGDTFSAALEVLVFCTALAAGWRMAMGYDEPAKPRRDYWGLTFLKLDEPKKLSRVALGLLTAATLYELTLITGSLDVFFEVLPTGTFSIVRTLFDSAVLAGTLIGGYTIGNGVMHPNRRIGFWLMVLIYCLAKCSSILLSSMTGAVAATALGYFLGARRPPWFFLIVVAAAASFLNLSKFEMRAKYWNDYGYNKRVGLTDLPAYYLEWSANSLQVIGQNRTISSDEEEVGQQLTDRLNNLQNLLYAQDAINRRGVPLLGGETYYTIPELLIPRFLWPNKPRSHEGQVMLNVHFGRQRVEDTFTTYIAWGLLAEAYGNFGAFWGAIFCGLFLGLASGVLERWIRPYPLASLESFFFLLVAVNFSLSFEMVASVWVTSIFQMVVALVASVAPFAKRENIVRPAAS